MRLKEKAKKNRTAGISWRFTAPPTDSPAQLIPQLQASVGRMRNALIYRHRCAALCRHREPAPDFTLHRNSYATYGSHRKSGYSINGYWHNATILSKWSCSAFFQHLKGNTVFAKRIIQLFCFALSGWGWGMNAFAAQYGTPDEAVAMVKKAVAFAKAKGKEQLLAEVSNGKGQFIDRDLYLSVYDASGMVLAHGVNPKLIGKSVYALSDPDGKLFIQDILKQAKAEGKGREDYKWPHPVTKEYQAKSAYFEVVDGVIVSCGFYKY
jgi:cytochrome c